MSISCHSSLLLSALVGLTTLLSPLPANAIFVVTNPGGVDNIPAGSPGSATFSLDINNTSGSPLAVSNVTLSIASLTATDLADIQLYLLSPSLTNTLTLKDDGSNLESTHYTDVTFTDSGLSPIDTATDPITGSFRPEGSSGTSLTSNITTFAGFQSVILTPGLNTWTLSAFNFGAEPASISGITLNVTPVPLETDALPILISAAFMGTGIWLKRRKNGKK